ncbi:hypothetical protein K458DRAFT_316534 [Lentithecium fluviatile CBS 122367]|uniref:Required for respiratory growth protein 9, mitochondrial n=1 Tax=Lentithecium fluviatile CBS 122367 TaxID=1168545 RepID=A0A6G1IKP6_9PLEO|nr:hypothetical protein K458DRAFT_316534 [Lentithecium fluviatile CBS 122367]
MVLESSVETDVERTLSERGGIHELVVNRGLSDDAGGGCCGANWWSVRSISRKSENWLSFPDNPSTMNCNACSRQTLSLFIRSFTKVDSLALPRPNAVRSLQPPRFLSSARRVQSEQARVEPPKPFATNRPPRSALDDEPPDERPAWQIHKEKVKEKLGGEAWNPRKKLSPDAMEGIRHLNQTQPDRFTTPVLAQHFKVSPEAIRRILKSKWRPTDEEAEQRLRRWDKRGEKIWSNLVELGIKPPKKWREMGVGRAMNGERPKWKSRVNRYNVPVHDSVTIEESVEHLIPIVDGKAHIRQPQWEKKPLSDRLGV